MSLCCRRRLFTNDFKLQVEALDMLSASLTTEFEAVLSCIDLLLQWMAARICDANTACLLQTLSFTDQLFNHMADQVNNLSTHTMIMYLG